MTTPRLLAPLLLLLAPLSTPSAQHDEDGGLRWFEGTFEEALRTARAEDRLLFVDFWADWCGPCKRMDRETFADPRGVAALADVVCVSVDVESRTGQPLAVRYGATSLPTLAFLEADGSLRDRLVGFHPPAVFLTEVQRIVAGEGTVSGLRARITADPDDLAARYALAQKLLALGDARGHDAELEQLRARDPEGRSVPMQHVRLGELYRALDPQDPDPTPLESFLATATDSLVLFFGYDLLASLYGFHRQGAEGDRETGLFDRQLAAWRISWAHCPPEHRVRTGGRIAWTLWEARGRLDAATKAFALHVALGASHAAPEDPDLLDTLACCYHLNGMTDEALAAIDRALELAPESVAYRKRRAFLRGE